MIRVHAMVAGLGLACCWAAFVGSAQGQEAQAGQRWAVLIGVEEYAAAKDLTYCVDDQQALAKHLVAAGFNERQVYLLCDGAKESKYLPFKSNIQKQLGLVFGLAEPNDVLLVGFSGHGVQLGEKAYFCPTDADLDNADSLVSLDWVYDQLRRSRASFKMVIVDACRDDPQQAGFKSTANDAGDFAPVSAPPEGILLLSSCSPGERSVEDEELGHGVFISFLLSGLQGQADTDKDGNRDGRVSLKELSSYAGRETKLHVARKFSDSQRPFLRGDLTIEALDFDLGQVAKISSTPVPPKSVNPPVLTNSLDMKLALIPAGEFDMGSPNSVSAQTDERPQHRVRITKPFYMSQYEVTVGQFGQFVSDQAYRTDGERAGSALGLNATTGTFPASKSYTWRTPGYPQTDDHPVVVVSWNDATAFCAWLSAKEKRTYRLPTEAEWEYACRAGTTTIFCNGDDPEGLIDVANVADGDARARYRGWTWAISGRDGHIVPSPIGSFQPNAFGLYDMHGNAWEWCQDLYSSNFYSRKIADDPVNDANGGERVWRGGSWHSESDVCRSADRSSQPPTFAGCSIGFRVSCAVSQ